MSNTRLRRHVGAGLLALALVVAAAVYWPGLSGSWLFDDYPNIVDNHGVQPSEVSIPALVRATLSSPASEFKRPLASLSFAANYLATGLDPYWMKLTNLAIHLLNGLLVFVLARLLLQSANRYKIPAFIGAASAATSRPTGNPSTTRDGSVFAAEAAPTTAGSPLWTDATVAAGNLDHSDVIAALIAASWMLLPINLTAVLYVVQRMESIANLFILLGLIGYVVGRQRMLAADTNTFARDGSRLSFGTRSFIMCLLSITLPAGVGVLAKETAVMLPLYAFLVEWALFRFRTMTARRDWRILAGFLIVLVLPMLVGFGWLLPDLLRPEAWATRDFTLGTRLLSETRIVVDYIRWTLLPTLDALSFYHDDFRISTGLLTPWSTLASLVFLIALVTMLPWLRARQPLAALGIALFFGCQLLAGTVLPLELIYEHRNYFASFGLLLALVPLLAVPRPHPFARLRYTLLAGLMLSWATLTSMTAYAWGNPLRLAQELAARAPQSPRAQYELGRTYIIYSHYDPASPFTRLAYAPLEKAAALPDFSILPEQALIFMNARMQLPLKDAWWDSMIAKLKARATGVQDESALASLTQCARDGQCKLPPERMKQAFAAALSHPLPTARLLSTYGDYAWNVLGDHALGTRATAEAVKAKPDEPAYRITLIRMLVAQGHTQQGREALRQLRKLNFGGRLNAQLTELDALPGME